MATTSWQLAFLLLFFWTNSFALSFQLAQTTAEVQLQENEMEQIKKQLKKKWNYALLSYLVNMFKILVHHTSVLLSFILFEFMDAACHVQYPNSIYVVG